MPNMSMPWLRWFNTVGSLLPIGLFVLLPTASQAEVIKTAESDLPQTSAEFSLLPYPAPNDERQNTAETLALANDLPLASAESERYEIGAVSVNFITIEHSIEYADSNLLAQLEDEVNTDASSGDTSESVVVETSGDSESIEPSDVEPANPNVNPESIGESVGTESTESPSTNPVEPTATESMGTESIDPRIDTSTNGESTSESTNSDANPNPEATHESAESEPQSEETAETEPLESEPTAEAEPELTPAERQRRELLIQADALYLSGNIEAAEKLYRQAKDPLWKGRNEAIQSPVALYDPDTIAPAAQVYWREGMMGLEAGLETRSLIPLRLLVEQYPEFIPGHIQLAEALQQYEQTEEALTVLDQAVALYPNEPSLIRAHAQALAGQEQWMEASIAARQFALLNQSVPEAKKFRWMANEYLDEFKSEARTNQWGSAIANVITGTISAVVTGNIFAPISGVSSSIALLQGEERIGEQVANQARRQLPLVHDPDITAYVDDIGQRLAQVAGRDEFEYEFEVVLDDRLNAFALPGGKIFVNAGAIAETESEAELAGLLAHELAHTVLSHGFQLVTEGNLTASLAQYLPFGGTIADLLIMGYSRDMERQADVLGTQILTSAGYAADGLHNLMVTLEEQEEDSPTFSWLSTHPLTDDRVEYTAEVVEERNFNRYQYEGIARHNDIQIEVRALLAKFERKIEAIEERQR